MREAGSDSVSGTVQQLAQIARTDPESAQRAIDELRATKTAEVAVRAGKITIVSRRYRRELHSSQLAVNRQRRRRARLRGEEPSRSGNEGTAFSSSSSIAAAAEEGEALHVRFSGAIGVIVGTFPATDDRTVEDVLRSAIDARSGLTDAELREGLVRTLIPKQYSAALWLRTLPRYLRALPCSACGGHRRVFNADLAGQPDSVLADLPEERVWLPCPACGDTRKPAGRVELGVVKGKQVGHG